MNNKDWRERLSPGESEWGCYLFGGDKHGVFWVPRKDNVPNWFWRKMQYIFFGNRWVKEVQDE